MTVKVEGESSNSEMKVEGDNDNDKVEGGSSDSEVKVEGDNDNDKMEGGIEDDIDIYLVNTHININFSLTFLSCLK